MKRLFILMIVLSFQLSSGQDQAFELSAYQSVAPDFSRQKIKIQNNHHYINGYLNLGVHYEAFKLEDLKANEFGVDLGYTFINFVIPIEMTPQIGFGWYNYENRTNTRFIFGYDFAYLLSDTIKLHALANVSPETWTVIEATGLTQVGSGDSYVNRDRISTTLFIGLSINL